MGNNQNIIIFTLPDGSTQTFTQGSNSAQINNTEYYGSTGTNMPPSSSYSAYTSSTYGQSQSGGNSQGIPSSQIPQGQENLYILNNNF